jgi:hypothetical protein
VNKTRTQSHKYTQHAHTPSKGVATRRHLAAEFSANKFLQALPSGHNTPPAVLAYCITIQSNAHKYFMLSTHKKTKKKRFLKKILTKFWSA